MTGFNANDTRTTYCLGVEHVAPVNNLCFFVQLCLGQ